MNINERGSNGRVKLIRQYKVFNQVTSYLGIVRLK